MTSLEEVTLSLNMLARLPTSRERATHENPQCPEKGLEGHEERYRVLIVIYVLASRVAVVE